MFCDKKKRYMTRMIDEVVHVEIQKILWDLIDEQRQQDKELDYLQVFELKNIHGKQHIVHRQEIPERRVRWTFELKHTTPIETTIWCIDSDEYQMMLLPSDY
ncbi:MAG TPA: DUF960 family protein [Virgibacillus sp.]|nr:DUF960 family protein [Virgibacillus sp.]HLR65539.1 DUF960 family protein [Virgibacillus sp.]